MTADDMYTIAGSGLAAGRLRRRRPRHLGPAEAPCRWRSTRRATLHRRHGQQLSPRGERLHLATSPPTPAAGRHRCQRRRQRPGDPGRRSTPRAGAFDAQGDIYIADTCNNRVQEIAASNHTQWGIAMTAGDVYTVAGQAAGPTGCRGDGGPGHPVLPRRPLERRRRRRRRPVHRRHRQQPDPGGPGRQRHPVGPADDGRRHVHHRRQLDRDGRLLRRRRRRPPRPCSTTRRRWPWTRPATSTSPTRTTTGSRRSPLPPTPSGASR